MYMVCVFLLNREGNGSINLQTMFENCTRLRNLFTRNSHYITYVCTFKKNWINETRTTGL